MERRPASERSSSLATDRWLKFGVAGGAAAVVNLVTVWLGVSVIFAGARAATEVSVALGIGVSTGASFAFHQSWTWADRVAPKERFSLLRRAARYYVVCGASAALQFLVSFGARELLGMHYLIASMVGIAIAAVTNYVASARWVFFARTSEPAPMPAGGQGLLSKPRV
ncbi:MAG TPA: GtrA family protein [Kofleriaceae bacterium]